MLCTRSLYSIKLPNEEIDYKYLTGVLNSLLIQYYYTTKFKSETELFPKIRIAQVKEIPIPCASTEIQEMISGYVDQILKRKESNLEEDITDLENNIDRIVYELYGLSYDDILVVDPKTTIKRDEYEKEK